MTTFSRTVLLCLLAAASPLAGAIRDVPPQGEGTYIVVFESPPLAAWQGGKAPGGEVLKATSPAVTGEARLDPESSASRRYLDYLAGQRQRILGEAGALLKRALEPSHEYGHALNGVALDLSAGEAKRLAGMEGVARVMPDEILRLETDAGPEWIGAPQVWDGAAPFSGAGNQGEGMVIGVIDSGINARHESFADVGGDGYDHDNPRNQRFGLCNGGGATCNDKLIGIYDFTDEGSGGEDTTGHGSHVASIAAGNHVDATLNGRTLNLNVPISGVAPHANLISYKACQSGNGELDEGCPLSALLDSIDQAVADGVDVINYSIGSFVNRDSPWNRPDAVAMRNAVGAGIVVVSSAGNEGPGPESITHPATAPWVIAAANATHDRRFINRLTDMSGGDNPPPMTLTGVGFTGGVGPVSIVHASEFGNALCGEGPQNFPPTGESNPFGPNEFDGQIVVCDRGIYARVEKGFNVNESGAGGYVLANTESWGEDIVSDDHYLPGVHLGFQAGEQLRQWLSGGGDRTARITGAERSRDPSFGDVVASSSSRGPAKFTPDVMKPDIAAPGTDVLGADLAQGSVTDRYQFLSGTSMASPHVAGAAALVRAAHPDWSVAAVHSALLATALPEGMTDAAGPDPAGARARGAGRVNVASAVSAGLVLEESANAFRNADPETGGVPRNLNLASLAETQCLLECSWQRRVKAVRGGISWRIEADVPDGVDVIVSPATFTMSEAGQTRNIEITADVRDAPIGEWVNGNINLVPESGGGNTPVMALPLSVFVSGGELPEKVQFNASRRGGSVFVPFDGLVPLPDLTLEASALAPGERSTHTLRQDPTRGNPYDNLNDGTTFFRTVVVESGDRLLVAETLESTAQDMDLYVGRDSGDGEPAIEEELCASISPDAREECVIRDPQPGNYWVLVQNWQSTANADQVDLVTAVVPGAGEGLFATGPASTDLEERFEIRVGWDRADMNPGSRWYGLLSVGSEPAKAGNLGLLPVIIQRSNDAAIEPLALVPGQTRSMSLPGDTGHDGLFVDVPPDAEEMTLEVIGEQFANLQLFARRGERFSGRDLDTLEAEADASGMGIPQGQRLVLDAASGLEPGRWYIAPFNDAFSNAAFEVSVELETSGEPFVLDRGMWFNPDRSGHGIDLQRSGDNLFVVWFTYEEDGTPVWYLAAGPRSSNAWSAPLERFVWNGDSARSTVVGRVTLTFDSPESGVFSWRLNGLTGSESFRPCVGSGICIPGGLGTDDNRTGHWFDPLESGWGDTVVTRGDIELHTLYVYDAAGNPRWLQGVNGDRFNTDVTELFSFLGFCPTCERVEPATEPAGELSTTFLGTTVARFEIDATLPPEWPGEWQRETQVETLSDPPQ